jgi:nucleotide-binding universal stress UspA family protein
VTILVGFRGTPDAERAVVEAALEARLRHAPLHVLYYLAHEPGESPTQVRHDLEASRAAEEELERLRERLVDDGIEATVEVVHGLHGGAAQAILDAAHALSAQLIVLGVRDRSAIDQFIFGSVGREVMRAAPCPVLTVRAEAE